MNRGPPASRSSPLSYRELLATRVLPMCVYCQELRVSNGQPPKEIPVPLWPGESLQQYEREFMRWLVSRELSFTVIRDNPVAERKYRLQFAHTRVDRRGAKSARVAALSRSRSKSRPSPRKAFAELQERPRSATNENKQHPIRRSVSGSGLLMVSSPTSGRSRDDERRSREHPQAASYTAAHKAPRSTSTWQSVRDDDPRRRYDDRASFLRDVYRQQVGDTPRRNRSVPRSGRYDDRHGHNEGSLPPACRSSSSCNEATSKVEDLRKRLLAKRVVPVEVFRDEITKLRNGMIRKQDLRRPDETIVRIPLIMRPGETMVQYTQEFERWLVSRDVQLMSLRDNPAKERTLWQSFACVRAGILEPSDPEVGSQAASRHSSYSRSRSIARGKPSDYRGRRLLPYTNAENRTLTRKRALCSEGKRQAPWKNSPSDQARESNSTWIQTLPPLDLPIEDPRCFQNKARWQLLERRVISLEIFQKEMDKNHGTNEAVDQTEDSKVPAIPVPLLPGESMGFYDHLFWNWLSECGENKCSLRYKPDVERKYRISFAYLRLKRPQALSAAGDNLTRTEPTRTLQPNTETQSQLSVDVVESAPARSVMKMETEADGIEHQTQARSACEEPCIKRARIDVEPKFVSQARVTSELSSSLLTVHPEHDRSATLSSNQESPRSSSESTTIAIESTRGIAPTLTTDTVAAAATSVPVAILPLISEEKRSHVVEKRSRCETTVSSPTRVPSKSDSSIARATMSRSPAAPSEMKTSPAISTDVAATMTKKPTFPLPKSVANDESDRLNQGVLTNSAGNDREATAPSQSKTESVGSTGDLAITNLASPLMLQCERSSEVSSPKREPVTVALSPSPSAPLAALGSPTTLRLVTAAIPAPARQSAYAYSAKATPVQADSNIHIIKDGLADTSTPAFKSSSVSLESAAEVSETESDIADGCGPHDGDVMNPDGCCCTKCIRNWAKTVTHRMNRLEQNVADLKRQVLTDGRIKLPSE